MLIVARVVSLENFFTFVFSTFWPLPLWIGFVLWSWCWRGTNELLWGLSSKSSFGGNHLIYGMLISWCPLSKSVTCSWGSCNCACLGCPYYFGIFKKDKIMYLFISTRFLHRFWCGIKNSLGPNWMTHFSFWLGWNTHTKRLVLFIIKFVDEEVHSSSNKINNLLRNKN